MKLQSVLFGNGLNLLNEGVPSWDELLEKTAEDDLEENIPYTLKYELIILKKPYREKPQRFITADGKSIITADGKLLYASGEVCENRIKEDIADCMSSFKPNSVYKKMASELPVDHFITTNYDNTLLKVIGSDDIKERYCQEQSYIISRHYSLTGGKIGQEYWTIHGNVESPQSIMLGYDQYCGELSKIESYLEGEYELPGNGRVSSIIKRLEDRIHDVYSWVDLFFVSDVHIIGQGLKYEESDIWWVLNKRRRIRQKTEGLISNHIIYYPDYELSKDKRYILKGFDVEICDLREYPANKRCCIYMEQLENMKRRMVELKV